MKKFYFGTISSATFLLAALILYRKLWVHHDISPVFVVISVGLILVAVLALASLTAELRGSNTEFFSNIWLLLCSVAVSYIVLDLAAGYFLIKPLSPRNIPDSYRHHKLEPGTYSHFKTSDYDYVQRVNNLGLRGEDITLEKQPGTFRIVMLGDSFTMGNGVADENTFSVYLENRLNDKHGDARSIQVLNAGVDSYTPFLEYYYLTRELYTLALDLVVLNFDMSDLVQEEAYRKAASYSDDGTYNGFKDTGKKQGQAPDRVYTEKFWDWVDRHLFFTRLLVYYINGLAPSTEVTVRNVVYQGGNRILKHTLEGDVIDRSMQWRNVFESIKATRDYCAERGIGFLLTIYPWGHQVSDEEWVPGRNRFITPDAQTDDRSVRTIVEFARQHDIDLVNTFPAFRSHPQKGVLYHKYNMHWTPLGHEVMARELEEPVARFLEDSAG